MRATLRICVVICVLNIAHGLQVRAADYSSLTDFLPPGQDAFANAVTVPDLGLGVVGSDGLSSTRVLHLMQRVPADTGIATRGAKEAQLYREVSPSVVLIVVDDGLGSGSVIAPGQILTSYHVVQGSRDIGVIFKPKEEGHAPTGADVVRAMIFKADPLSDLALLSYSVVARPSINAIELGSKNDIEVGGDVSAIGHPTGEAWTFTRGIISQFRKDYKWKASDEITHEADVVQTQTPINPGNSGGPLLATSGKLIGVNAFKSEGEGLNFAIAVTTVRKFLSSRIAQKPGPQTAKPECKPKLLYQGRDKTDTSFIKLFDVMCTGKANALYRVPDDKNRSIAFLLDTRGTGKADISIYDWDRDGKWDYSLHSITAEDKIDLIGHHTDGTLEPTWYEPYVGQPTPWAN